MKLFLLLSWIITGVASASPRFDKSVDRGDLPIAIERHKRIFFVSGTENTKLQVSFKIPVFLKSNFYFAYTETGFWKLFQKTSNPFLDINHNPEVFYRWNAHIDHSIDFGVEHLSNGRDKLNSRSWNSTYLQTMSRYKENFYYTAKFFHIWDVDHTNEQIYDYLGFMDLEVGLREVIKSQFKSNEIFVRWRPGGKLDLRNRYDTVEVGFKIKLSEWHVFQHFFFTYYNGYAENQINFDKYIRAFRAGLTF